MLIRVLGALDVLDETNAPVRLGSVSQRRLLAVLAARAPGAVASEELADLLELSQGALRTSVSRLRRIVGEDVLRTEAPGYALRTTDIDAVRFASLMEQAETAPPDHVASIVEEALQLWRGPAFAEFGEELWIRAEVARLHELRAAANEVLAEALLTERKWSAAIARLESHIAAEPYRDRPRGQLMRALAGDGRQTEALRAYESYRSFLAEEVGTEPSAAVHELSMQIASGEVGAETARQPRQMSTRTATVMAAELDDAAELMGLLGHDDFWRLNAELSDEFATIVTANGGRMSRELGDGLLAVYESVSAAVRSAIEMQQAASASIHLSTPERLRARIGISLGEIDDDGVEIVGSPLVEARQLCADADRDQILCSDIVARATVGRRNIELVSVGQRELVGLPGAIEVFHVPWSKPGPVDPWLFTDEDQSPFVGRVEHLAAIAEAAQRAATGVPQVLLITGERGAGKTRLVQEACRRLAERGAAVRVGRGGMATGGPFAAVAAAAQAHIEDLRGPRLPEALGTLATEIERLTRGTPSNLSGDIVARTQLYDAVGRVFRETVHQELVVLVLDDLQACGADTMALFRALAADDRAGQLLLIGTVANDGLTTGGTVESFLGHMRRERKAERMDLEPFSPAEVAELLTLSSGGRVGLARPSVVSNIHRRSGGNALFAVELVQQSIDEPDSLLVNASQVTDSVQELAAIRLASLSSDDRELLAAAAVVGEEFDLRVLGTVLGRTPDDLAEQISGPECAAIVEEVAAKFDSYHFLHPVVQEVLAASLGRRQRARLHLKTAESIAEVDPDVEALARHYAGAGPLAPAGVAVESCIAAGEQALDHLAFHSAVAHFDNVYQLAGSTGDDNVEYRAAFGRAVALTGLGEAEAARSDFDRAAAAARRLGDANLLASVALEVGARYNPYGGATPDRHKEAILQDALAVVDPHDHALRARLTSSMAAVVTADGGVKALEWADEAEQLAEQSGDQPVIGLVLSERDAILSGPDDLAERIARAERIIAIGEAEERDDLILRGTAWLAVASLEAGDADTLWTAARRRDELATRLADPVYTWMALMHRSLRLSFQGQLLAAEEAADVAANAGIPVVGSDARRFHLAQVSVVRGMRGLVSIPVEKARLFANSGEAPAAFEHSFIEVLLQNELVDEAQERFDRLSRPGEIARNFDWTRSMGRYVANAAELGRTNAADEAMELLLPFQGRMCSIADVGLALSVSHRLGQANAFLGRSAEASRCLDAAVAEYRKLGARPWAALAATERLEATDVVATPGDVYQSLHAAAREEAVDLDLDYLVERLTT